MFEYVFSTIAPYSSFNISSFILTIFSNVLFKQLSIIDIVWLPDKSISQQLQKF